MAEVEKELKRKRPTDEQADFVMSFVETAEEYMEPFEETWNEIESSFLVRPLENESLAPLTKYPLAFTPTEGRTSRRGRAILKDPETHQVVMSTVSGIILSISPEEGFIKAKHKGFEDIYKAKTVNGLLEYQDKLEGEFVSKVEWLLGAGIYGTGICEKYWDYIEEPRTLRTVQFNPETGEEDSSSTIMTIPVWDDPRTETFDIRDFFIDTGQSKLSRMKGAARHQKITAQKALALGELGVYKLSAVREAIERRHGSDGEDDSRKYGDETALNYPLESHPDFMELPMFRYCGEVPFSNADGYTRREIVVINGVTVRSEVWARRLPWFDCKITPRLGSFYGISPGEIMRYDQDFADTLKMMLADAVVRMVHPPNIYDRNQNVDLAKLRRFEPDVPIGADSVGAISQVPYNPPVQPAFQMYSGIKQGMRESSAQTAGNQGFGLGTNRKSASEAVGTFERAGIRPEMFNRVMEQEYLPPMGKYTLELYQEHLEDTEDLAFRVGESESTVALADILADYDVTFIGSRKAGTLEQELQAFREIISAGSNPNLFQLIPWIPLLRAHFDKLGASEVAAMVGNPQITQLNLMLTQLASPTTLGDNNPNGQPPSQPSPGSLPAQTFGGVS